MRFGEKILKNFLKELDTKRDECKNKVELLFQNFFESRRALLIPVNFFVRWYCRWESR